MLRKAIKGVRKTLVYDMTTAAKTANKQRGKPFKRGQSGNPNGRPDGSRNKATLAIDELLDGQAKAITQKAIDAALEGDMTAIRLCLDRVCPPRKERAISCKLPPVEKPADMTQAIRDVIAEVAAGNLTPGEGQALAGMIEVQRRVVETEEHERRLTALERK